jgi:murein L,D-transpeptidase YafK
MASAAVAGSIALAGCNTDDVAAVSAARAMKPLPPALVAEIEKRNMPKESPILVRIFKEEAELEVWKQDAEGKFALLKTYPICRWSGELGPKIKQGDRQAPEGFYNITRGQMNPNSNYYLAFDLGFPNAYDKANDRTGAFLMVHGDCSSAGCYAMTDEQIQEIYALGRDSFIGGQKSFQVQAYPFRMTPRNMARHRNSPNMAFWRMIKEGNDHFMVTRQEPQVDVCEKHYVFDARAPADASTPVVFRPRDKCPVYEVPDEIATAVKEKHDQDERAFAEYASRGIATVAVRTGTDGGMHPLFLAKLQGQPKPLIDFEAIGRDINTPNAPLPPSVNPPHAPAPDAEATASVGSSMTRLFGLGSSEAAEAGPPPNAKPATVEASAPASAAKQAAARPAPAPALSPAPAQASKAKPVPAVSPTVAQTANQPAPQPGNAAQPANLIAGAAPVVPAGTFDSRWGGLQ